MAGRSCFKCCWTNTPASLTLFIDVIAVTSARVLDKRSLPLP